jgi:hypothetical protein
MQLLKLTVLSSLLFTFAVSFISCERDSEMAKTLVYTKTDIPMTGAQSVPVSASTATGSLSVNYNKTSKTLNYSFTWTGLSAPPSKLTIYGPAPTGYGTSNVKQAIITAANPTLYPVSGSYTGSLTVDDVVIVEQELLNHLYYVTIITPAYPGGEIRGQIRFQ